MHSLIEIRHGNDIEVKKFSNMLEIDILRNSSSKYLGVLLGDFNGFGFQMMPRHPAG